MKFFLDTANIDEIKEVARRGILNGVTTNPTLVAKEKGSFDSIVKQICEIVDGPVNLEAINSEADKNSLTNKFSASSCFHFCLNNERFMADNPVKMT